MIAIAIGIAIAIEIDSDPDSDSDLDFAHLTNKKMSKPQLELAPFEIEIEITDAAFTGF